MGKTSYKNTEELIKEISEKVAELQSGELGIEELNTLVNNGKDLFEQLVILRYKAFDKFGVPEDSVEKETIENEPIGKVVAAEVPEVKDEPEETSFDFTSFSTEKEEEAEQPSFDFTLDEGKEEEATNDHIEEVKTISTAEDQNENEVSAENSLNDSLKQDELSLRKKLQNTPIADIKTHISIAKKFEYISIMFEGNSDEYDDAIDFLNTCATGNDARLKLNELTTNNNWDLENKSIINFIELVERRYL